MNKRFAQWNTLVKIQIQLSSPSAECMGGAPHLTWALVLAMEQSQGPGHGTVLSHDYDSGGSINVIKGHQKKAITNHPFSLAIVRLL